MQDLDVYEDAPVQSEPIADQCSVVHDDQHLIKLFFPTFRHFEFRRSQRIHGGAKYRHHAPVLSSVIIVLWLFNFALKSIQISNHAITLQFDNWYVVKGALLESGTIRYGVISIVVLLRVTSTVGH